ncbi:tyrosine-type recombinase/integrase [Nocardia sp. NPDC051756]|uniref:tyrosine-type recombinase/integrase n=1 Tax=Nocardia sp. NPDC051756 TaxID=3154751 RepID=UPI003439EA33
MTLLAGTGLRRSQALGLLWSDIDLDGRTLQASGKVVRIKGKGLVRVESEDDPKIRRGAIALPEFAVEMLKRRRKHLAARKLASPPKETENLDLVFPSAAWTLRDPQNVGHEWQRVRDALAIPDDVTAHSFRGCGGNNSRRRRALGASDGGHARPRGPGHDTASLHGPWTGSHCRSSRVGPGGRQRVTAKQADRLSRESVGCSAATKVVREQEVPA